MREGRDSVLLCCDCLLVSSTTSVGEGPSRRLKGRGIAGLLERVRVRRDHAGGVSSVVCCAGFMGRLGRNSGRAEGGLGIGVRRQKLGYIYA